MNSFPTINPALRRLKLGENYNRKYKDERFGGGLLKEGVKTFQSLNSLYKKLPDPLENRINQAASGTAEFVSGVAENLKEVSKDPLNIYENTGTQKGDFVITGNKYTDDRINEAIRGGEVTLGALLRFSDFITEKGGDIMAELAKPGGAKIYNIKGEHIGNLPDINVDEDFARLVGQLGTGLLADFGVGKFSKATKLGSKLENILAIANPPSEYKAVTTAGTTMDIGTDTFKSLNTLPTVTTAAGISQINRTSLPDDLNFIPDDIDLEPLIKETQKIRFETGLKINKGTVLDQIESSGSTLADLSKLVNDPRVYNSPKLRKLLRKSESLIDGAPYLEWHHKNTKTLTRPFVKKMEKLIELGLATEADLLNLGFISLEKGVGMGDRVSALIQMPRIAHQELHQLMRAAGIEPTGKALKAYKLSIENINNVEDLTRAFIKQIDDVSGVMTKEARLLNKAYQGVDDRLLDRFSGLTAERFTLRQLRTKLKKGLESSSEVMKQRSAERLVEIEARIKEVDALRGPVKNQVLQTLREKRKIITSPRRD